MVREAALLGLNAYSIFAGKLGAADAELERRGKLTMIRDLKQIELLELVKRPHTPHFRRSSETRSFICEHILKFATENRKVGANTSTDCTKSTTVAKL